MHGLSSIYRMNRSRQYEPEPEPPKPGTDVWACRFCGGAIKLAISRLKYNRRGNAKAVKVPARCKCSGARMYYEMTDGLEPD